ncbi:hypothetical protein KUL97_10325 [Synechococcus sp. HK05]|uniref:hypothetical protein n=1 Tax=Synechococcus sp. HK05 TaxID=2725975 RepID=UPI001C386033|nr:hypothetical protein [Synechococcus sp. HK05]MBV2352098.1 hypothetical protein [Synechococcus sp. HK05]
MFDLSIVVPTTKADGHIGFWQDLKGGALKDSSLRIQIVGLINLQRGDRAGKRIELEIEGKHQLVKAYSTNFAPTCEDNLARLLDFIGILGNHIIIIGDHDIIQWDYIPSLLQVFDQADPKPAAIGIGVLLQEEKPDGSYIRIHTLPGLKSVESNSLLERTLQRLGSGQSFPLSAGYPALVAQYGPMDWAAFIGNHIFTRNHLSRILSFRFTSALYRHVYQQLSASYASTASYAVFALPVVIRRSRQFFYSDNDTDKENVHNYRFEQYQGGIGRSAEFQLAHLDSLIRVPEPLSRLVLCSRAVGITRSEDGILLYKQAPFWQKSLAWCVKGLQLSAGGESFHLKEATTACFAQQDIRIIMDYLSFASELYDKVLVEMGLIPNNSESRACFNKALHYLGIANQGMNYNEYALDAAFFINELLEMSKSHCDFGTIPTRAYSAYILNGKQP